MFALRSIRAALIVGMLTVTTVAGTIGVAAAEGYSRNFIAHNHRDATVVALFIKPVDYDDWTATTGDRIAPGQYENISIDGFGGRCYFNLHARFADGTSSDGTFNLCAVTDVNV